MFLYLALECYLRKCVFYHICIFYINNVYDNQNLGKNRKNGEKIQKLISVRGLLLAT